MKLQADAHGTPSEQKRASVRWIAPSQRLTGDGYIPNRRCGSCRHFGSRCAKHGFRTLTNAVCETYGRVLS
jgi:hypothetical protein